MNWLAAYGVDIIILAMLVVTALAVVMLRNLLVATVLLSIFSLLMAVQYLVLGAPDVAITEAAVGAGISTILLLLGISLVGHEEKPASGSSLVPLLVVAATGAGLFYAMFHLPLYGDANAPAQTYLSTYYISKTGEEMGIPNMVTAVLASYRGFDTLGETTVVLTAAISVLLLLGGGHKRRKQEGIGEGPL